MDRHDRPFRLERLEALLALRADRGHPVVDQPVPLEIRDRRDGDAVQCRIYAQSEDQNVVGERTIKVPAGDPGTTTPTTGG